MSYEWVTYAHRVLLWELLAVRDPFDVSRLTFDSPLKLYLFIYLVVNVAIVAVIDKDAVAL